MSLSPSDLLSFAVEFRDGLIGTQPRASRGMCALVSIPLRAALKVLHGIDTDLVTENGHTFLVTVDGQCRIDPTIDQFHVEPTEKVQVTPRAAAVCRDERLTALPFVELMENFKRIHGNDGRQPGAKDAGVFVATYIYYPLAQQGFFDERMSEETDAP